DANTYAKWGIDYLKYDWCSYGGVPEARTGGVGPGYELVPDGDIVPVVPRPRGGSGGQPTPEGLATPHKLMGDALDASGRDIVYSLCQYGMGNVWTWGASTGGNLWRTTGDITDTWGSMSGIGFGQNGHEKNAAPGHWNDPDMLVVGRVGWGNPHP